VVYPRVVHPRRLGPYTTGWIVEFRLGQCHVDIGSSCDKDFSVRQQACRVTPSSYHETPSLAPNSSGWVIKFSRRQWVNGAKAARHEPDRLRARSQCAVHARG
jgi:hypothetical protein